ncbi:MAG: hypothetical protein JSW43_06320 [Gemmatimonadota bacterium]|nr:MAG: hypothetical protein JSW43_06320 [Gemmatimonadota bacterium]
MKREAGGVLLLVLVALVLVGALVSAGWLVGLHELRVADTAAAPARALAAAEEGAWAQVGAWKSSQYGALPPGGALSFAGHAGGALGSFEGSVRRLSELLFLIESDGRDPDDRARQRIGLIVRLRPLDLSISAALSASGSVSVAGGARLAGRDEPPAGWVCPPPGKTLPGLRLGQDAALELDGCPGGRCVTGAPPVLVDSAAESFVRLVGVEIAALRAQADKVIGPGLWVVGPSQVGGKCRYTAPSNWGDPDRPQGPCGEYLPLIFAHGDLRLHGGRGQGILVVDGDLTVSGGFRFFGPVVVLGQFDTTGEGGHFRGGVVAATVVVAQSTPVESLTVGYSSCAVRRAVVAQGTPEAVPGRSWLRLHQIP